MPPAPAVPDCAADTSLVQGDHTTLRHDGAARVVLDTNACLDLFLFVSPRSAKLRGLLETGALQAVSRPDCRDEWQRVLRYPGLGLDPARCAALEARYDSMVPALHADPARHGPVPRCRDPDDQKFLELARDAGALALVTRDAELLALARRAARAGLFHIVEPSDIDRIFAIPLGAATSVA